MHFIVAVEVRVLEHVGHRRACAHVAFSQGDEKLVSACMVMMLLRSVHRLRVHLIACTRGSNWHLFGRIVAHDRCMVPLVSSLSNPIITMQSHGV